MGPAPAMLSAQPKRFAAEKKQLAADEKKWAAEVKKANTLKKHAAVAAKKLAAAEKKLAIQLERAKGPSASAVDELSARGSTDRQTKAIRTQPGINIRAVERTSVLTRYSFSITVASGFRCCHGREVPNSRVGRSSRRSPQLESLEGRALLATINASGAMARRPTDQLQLHGRSDERQPSTAGIGTFWYAWTRREGLSRHPPDLPSLRPPAGRT